MAMRSVPLASTWAAVGLVVDDDDRTCPFQSLARAGKGEAVLVLWSDSLNGAPTWISIGLLSIVPDDSQEEEGAQENKTSALV